MREKSFTEKIQGARKILQGYPGGRGANVCTNKKMQLKTSKSFGKTKGVGRKKIRITGRHT